ncbi:putative CBS domain-containing protein [Serinicoccus hydrothermalis]|uniref:Putative CBS domain-containing protein n=1 Tax=Serinicoccus hydrothermalis TaxID=1758689 RepID=A0A1B1NB28_9MICO|nr:hemolysin family protein [Serinicoccus hydrothermalis]ANS78575.1 putative CBS domain-containing protein [Serinicoccus hydrothermalis]
MNGLTVTLVTALLIVLSALFVIVEFALLGARRGRLESQAEHSASARAALRGMNELTVMLAGAQLGITACTFALGAVTKPALDYWLGPILADLGLPGWFAGGMSFALSLLFVTFLHLVVGEMAPKSWAIAHPERAARLVALPMRGFITVVRPLLVWVNTIANRLVSASGVTPVDRAAVGGQDAQTIRVLVEQSAAEGALESSYQEQISDALELEELTLAQVAPEQVDLAAVGSDASIGDVQQAAARTGHKRILMLDDDTTDPRVVHVRDTLLHPGDRPAETLARPALVLPAATPVYEALTTMRQSGEQLAVLRDDGRLVGLVSIADIMHRVLPLERSEA